MKRDSTVFLDELKKDLLTYAEIRLELMKLGTYERTGKVISVLSYGLILFFLSLFFIFFLFVTLGFFLSQWIGSMGWGFFIVAMLYLALFGLSYLLRDKIKASILNGVINALLIHDSQPETKQDAQNPDTTH